MYSSVNLRPSSGVVNPWNSRRVWRPRLLRSTRNSTLRTPPCLIRRYTSLQAMKVLPLPVAICTSARGRPVARDSSRLLMARSCTGHRPDAFRGGMTFNVWRRL